ncbi:MAG: RNA polymerase sigma factor [Planctomycetes bacterium]|nr:RNA polymerase sigma factor [Planctomycetota bacterium]
MARNEPRTAAQHAASDADLLRAVAERRDQAAFAELYSRHEQAAYALARHMLRTSDAAEVAVQEAMLRVWKSAGKYRYDKNARGWLLRIVAFECIRIQKARRAEAARTEPLGEDLAGARGEDSGREEMLAGLRRGLERLPETNRQLVALYYLGGLTQEEIGKELAIPQQTVSNRLRDALKFLRSELSQLGLATALPLLDESALGDALAQSYASPAALKSGVLGTLARPGADAASQASRALSRKVAVPSLVWPLVALGVAVAVAAGGAYVALGPRSNNPVDPQAEAPKRKDAGEAAEAERAPLDRSWSFEDGLPDGFKVTRGTWTPIDPSKHGGLRGLASPASIKDTVCTVLPVEAPHRPFVVRLKSIFSPDHATLIDVGDQNRVVNGGINMIWYDTPQSDNILEYMVKHLYTSYTLDKPFVYDVDYYFLGKYVFRYRYGELQGVNVHAAAYPTRQVAIMAFGFGVSQLSIRELKDGEIPAELRDPEAKAEEIRRMVQTHQDGWK